MKVEDCFKNLLKSVSILKIDQFIEFRNSIANVETAKKSFLYVKCLRYNV